MEGESGGWKGKGEGGGGWRMTEVEEEGREEETVLAFMCPGHRRQVSHWHWASPSQSLGWICGPALPVHHPGPVLNLNQIHADIKLSTSIVPEAREQASMSASARNKCIFPEVCG